MYYQWMGVYFSSWPWCKIALQKKKHSKHRTLETPTDQGAVNAARIQPNNDMMIFNTPSVHCFM